MKSTLLSFVCVVLVANNQFTNGHGTADNMDPTTDHNKEHLKEDLNGVIDKKIEDMTSEELQFHYFRQHDYDGDNMLDGNEVVMSLLHHAKESSDPNANPFKNDEEIIKVVDDVLKFQDKNQDGKISYQEYITPFKADEQQVQT